MGISRGPRVLHPVGSGRTTFEVGETPMMPPAVPRIESDGLRQRFHLWMKRLEVSLSYLWKDTIRNEHDGRN